VIVDGCCQVEHHQNDVVESVDQALSILDRFLLFTP
jgi:hypothetical protein